MIYKIFTIDLHLAEDIPSKKRIYKQRILDLKWISMAKYEKKRVKNHIRKVRSSHIYRITHGF